MSEERNKSYRIRTSVDTKNDFCLNVNMNQDYDTFEILSLKIDQSDVYNLHNSDYGVIVGRVVANNGFGVPNAKVSVFVSANTENDSDEIQYIYPYTNVSDKNYDDIRYNLLPDRKVSDCHKPVGTFPNKTYLLNNDVLMEVFDKYYTLTTRTNDAGDYMFCGVPTGNVTLHMDCDLSDCGVLSQRPRDMVYKGYDINQFESANEFKSSTALDSLRQILSQDKVVYVNPFWGNESLGETIGITRCDIDLNYKFEPTCVFIGSIVGDSSSNGLSKKCVPTNKMGSMEEMVTGQGRIEMIRKTLSGNIESFSIKGTQLIDGDGTWCYQIPMNLDYVMTDEYGNIVSTDDPEKGIPTRSSVRFRVSMLDFDGNSDTYLRAKILVPHNPMDTGATIKNSQIIVGHEDYDYSFGTDTRDDSFRDLLWNNVYTVKQYIPRFQYTVSNKEERFTGIKGCNHFGNNNPMPYNSIRIRLPFMFTLLCALIKAYVRIVTIINKINSWICAFLRRLSRISTIHKAVRPAGAAALQMRLTAIADGLCPDLENWYFTPYNGDNIIGQVFYTNNDAAATSMGNVDDIDPGDEYAELRKSISDDDYTLAESWVKENDVYYKSLIAKRDTAAAIAAASLGADLVSLALAIKYKEEAQTYLQQAAVCHALNPNTETALTYCIKNNQIDKDGNTTVNLYNQTLNYILAKEGDVSDNYSVDASNADEGGTGVCITTKTDYLMSCIEMNLAQEYRVINFDFYNDWVNGVLYFPRWAMEYRPKKTYLFGLIKRQAKTKGCMADRTIFSKTRKYVQQCSLHYSTLYNRNLNLYTTITSEKGCKDGKERCHKNAGRNQVRIFGKNGGIIKQEKTILNDDVYYYKPCEWTKIEMPNSLYEDGVRVNLFATDIVLLGSLNDCSLYGIPQAFKGLSGSSYKMPTNLALTNMDDSGYLYAMSGGTACVGTKGATKDIANDGVKRSTPTYSATEKYYSSLSGSDSYITYGTSGDTDSKSDTNNYHDLFPVTEAAGISWNYAGPGQGDNNSDKLYYPGGHFLGLSCVNSQTNIKSCINLQRICEIGASMSQRREVIVGHEVDKQNNIKLITDYFIPTGFISNVDITGQSFRSMFATMNAKRLIVDPIDEITGYKKYSFLYLNPNGFDGKMEGIIKPNGSIANNSAYNSLIDTSSQKSDVTYMTSGLTSYIRGIKYTIGGMGHNFSDDYDINELDRTYAKTVESVNKYYSLFRFGLDGSEDATFVRSKFLLQDGEDTKGSKYMSLPQYQNSFYFYFGLKDGATAFDRFIGEFFSECETTTQESSNAYVIITKNGIDKPVNNSIVCSVFNVTKPYTCLISSEGRDDITVEGIVKETFTIDNLDAGTYVISVTDANNVVVSTKVTFALPEIYASYTESEFEFKIKDTSLSGSTLGKANERARMAKKTNSGYIDLDDIVEIGGENYYATGSSQDGCNVVFVDSENGFFITTNKSFSNVEEYIEGLSGDLQLSTSDYVISNLNGTDRVYLMTQDVYYDVYVGYRLVDGSEAYVKYDSVYVSGIDNMDIVFGCNYLSYSNQNDENNFTLKKLYNEDGSWWLDFSSLDSKYPKTTWLLIHTLMDQTSTQSSSFDANIFCIHKDGNVCNDYILFGQPENIDNLYTENTGIGCNYIFSTRDANKYYGYSVNDTNIYHHTISDGTIRGVFGKMLIDDRIPLSEPITGITFTSYSVGPNDIHTFEFSGNLDERYVMTNHGCIISDGENNVFAIRIGNNKLGSYSSNINTSDLLGLTIRPLIYYPTISKKTKVNVTYYYWNNSDTSGYYVHGKCYGTIHNGMVDFNSKFGETNWFSGHTAAKISTYDEMVSADYNYYDLPLGGEYETSFGLDANTSKTYCNNLISPKLYPGSFYINEGVPESVLSINNKLLNEPEEFKVISFSSSSSTVFSDTIIANKISGTEYTFIKKKRSDSALDESGDIKYYAVTMQSAILPFVTTGTIRTIKDDIKDCLYDYYDGIISDESKSKFIDSFGTSQILNDTLKFVIGVSSEINGTNGVTRMYKFYLPSGN